MEQTETPVVEIAGKYELMVIFLPDLGEEAIKKELTEIKKLLSNDGGDVFNEDIWGLKDLAYRIRKQDEGYYAVLNFALPGDKIAELEHLLNIHQTVLRYLITKTPFDYKIRTLKEYTAESEKLDQEEQKVKDEAAARKGRKRPVDRAAVRPKDERRLPSEEKAKANRAAAERSEAEAPSEDKVKAKAEETASAPSANAVSASSEEEGGAKIEETATAPSASEASTSSEEEAEAKKEETAPAAEEAETKQETATAPKKTTKKAEKDDLDDFDKRLKSIIDDPDISL